MFTRAPGVKRVLHRIETTAGGLPFQRPVQRIAVERDAEAGWFSQYGGITA